MNDSRTYETQKLGVHEILDIIKIRKQIRHKLSQSWIYNNIHTNIPSDVNQIVNKVIVLNGKSIVHVFKYSNISLFIDNRQIVSNYEKVNILFF